MLGYEQEEKGEGQILKIAFSVTSRALCQNFQTRDAAAIELYSEKWYSSIAMCAIYNSTRVKKGGGGITK